MKLSNFIYRIPLVSSVCFFILIGFSDALVAQKLFSKSATISFFSSTPVEDIAAVSHSASTVLDIESSRIQWAVLIKSFEFKKALMQEHFNENYMESSKFPKASFKGQIQNLPDLTVDGEYKVDISGVIEIHGAKKDIESVAILSVIAGKVSASCQFNVLLADYDIEVPALVRSNISESIAVDIKVAYETL